VAREVAREAAREVARGVVAREEVVMGAAGTGAEGTAAAVMAEGATAVELVEGKAEGKAEATAVVARVVVRVVVMEADEEPATVAVVWAVATVERMEVGLVVAMEEEGKAGLRAVDTGVALEEGTAVVVMEMAAKGVARKEVETADG
jgi:hypothetical protein